MRGVIITGTGTGVGKTFVARGIARALVRRGTRVAAIKPIETGCAGEALDAAALARACAEPDVATAPGLHRVRSPLSPHAAALGGEAPCPTVDAVAEATRGAARDRFTIIEGAGGLLVPLDARATAADLFRALALPLVLVAPDALGVLSHVLTAVESARARSLDVLAVVLSRHVPEDPSRATNAAILGERTLLPVIAFPAAADDDDALAFAAEAAGLVGLALAARA